MTLGRPITALRQLSSVRVPCLKRFASSEACLMQTNYRQIVCVTNRAAHRLRLFRSPYSLLPQNISRSYSTALESENQVKPSQSNPSPPTTNSGERLLSYHVSRTPSNNLPIYELAKAGGNRHLTRIRKISGNVQALRDEIRELLGLPKDQVTINPLTNHIIIKGWHKGKIEKFLESKRL